MPRNSLPHRGPGPDQSTPFLNLHPRLWHISWGHSFFANAVGFGTFPWFSEFLVLCARISFPWGGGYILFEICKKRPFLRDMGHGGGGVRDHILERS